MKWLFTSLLFFIFSSTIAQFTYHWRQISGPVQTIVENPDSASTRVTGLNQVGIYDFEFAVTNMFGTGLDTCTVTVVSGALSIHPDSVYHFQRPKIKKLEIKAMTRDDNIFIQIKSPKPQQITCYLYDILGRKLAKSDIQLWEGTNIVKLPKPRIAGLYILRFETYFDVMTQKIII